VLRGRDAAGSEHVVELSGPSLVIAVKPNCDGCHAFIFGDLAELAGVTVHLLSASAPGDDEWRGAARDVLIAPASLEELDVRSAPHYLVVDPLGPAILTEGIPFSPAQVATEIASFLS